MNKPFLNKNDPLGDFLAMLGIAASSALTVICLICAIKTS